MRSYTAILILAAAASVAPALAAPIAYTAELEVRGDFDNLEARAFDDTLARREFDEELFARALNDDLVARSKIGRKIGGFFKKAFHTVVGVAKTVLKREDMDVLARELGIDEEVFARDVYDGLEARDFDDDVLFARDLGLDEDLFTRDIDENQFVARALGLDEHLVARSKIGRKIGHFFKKAFHAVVGVVSKVLKREDAEVLARDFGFDEELFARSFDDYEISRRDLEELFTRMPMEELDARAHEETEHGYQANTPSTEPHPVAHGTSGAAHTGEHHRAAHEASGASQTGEHHRAHNAAHSAAHRRPHEAHQNGGHAQHPHQTSHRQTGDLEAHDHLTSASSSHRSKEHSQQHPSAQRQTREDMLDLLVRAFDGEFDELD